MRIAVIGAGIVGVTTTCKLARDSHQVTVFERRSSVAEEISFANDGRVAPGNVTPWAAPRQSKVLRDLLSRHVGLGLYRKPLATSSSAGAATVTMMMQLAVVGMPQPSPALAPQIASRRSLSE